MNYTERVATAQNGLLGYLETAAALIDCGQERRGLDLAFEKIDEALKQGRFARVDYAVRDFRFDFAAIDLCVLILMATKPAARDITHREHAVEVFRHRLEKERHPRREGILRWL